MERVVSKPLELWSVDMCDMELAYHLDASAVWCGFDLQPYLWLTF